MAGSKVRERVYTTFCDYYRALNLAGTPDAVDAAVMAKLRRDSFAYAQTAVGRSCLDLLSLLSDSNGGKSNDI